MVDSKIEVALAKIELRLTNIEEEIAEIKLNHKRVDENSRILANVTTRLEAAEKEVERSIADKGKLFWIVISTFLVAVANLVFK